MSSLSGLPSPAHTDILSDYSPVETLPIPRLRPLPASSAKLQSLIHYLDEKTLHVNGRYSKSFAEDPTNKSSLAGYTEFIQVIADIDGLVNVVWMSATPSIQFPYLLMLAGYFRSYMHSFAFETKSFILARKFDTAFSTLLKTAFETGDQSVSMTMKVRIKSLAQETRFEMIEVATKNGLDVEDDSDEEPTFEDVQSDSMTIDIDTDHTQQSNQSIAMSLGKVYEKTLDLLGEDLDSLPPVQPQVENSVMAGVESFDL